MHLIHWTFIKKKNYPIICIRVWKCASIILTKIESLLCLKLCWQGLGIIMIINNILYGANMPCMTYIAYPDQWLALFFTWLLHYAGVYINIIGWWCQHCSLQHCLMYQYSTVTAELGYGSIRSSCIIQLYTKIADVTAWHWSVMAITSHSTLFTVNH